VPPVGAPRTATGRHNLLHINALIHERKKCTRAHEQIAPLRIIACARFGLDNFGQGPTLFLESGRLVADFNQHVSEQDQVGPSANRPATYRRWEGADSSLLRSSLLVEDFALTDGEAHLEERRCGVDRIGA
jgi:hypothetical protein